MMPSATAGNSVPSGRLGRQRDLDAPEMLDDAELDETLADWTRPLRAGLSATARMPYEPERPIVKSKPHLIGAGSLRNALFYPERASRLADITALGVNGTMARGTASTDSAPTPGDASPRRRSSRPMAVGAR
jgi:hypothetical protein